MESFRWNSLVSLMHSSVKCIISVHELVGVGPCDCKDVESKMDGIGSTNCASTIGPGLMKKSSRFDDELLCGTRNGNSIKDLFGGICSVALRSIQLI